MSLGPPGSKERQRDAMTPDTYAHIDPVLHKRWAMHIAETESIPLDERRELLAMFDYPPASPS